MKTKNTSGVLFVIFLVLVNSTALLAQGKLVSIKGSVRDQSTRGKLSGAVVQLMKGGSQEKKIVTPNSGSYEFELEYDNNYTITYLKGGYVTKRLEVNTGNVPEDDKNKGWYKMNVDMTLFEEVEGLDVSILKKPIGKFKFDTSKKEFAHDPVYTASIKSKLSELMANYDKKKKEEAEKLKEEESSKKDKSLSDKKFKILMSKGDEAFTSRDYGRAIDSYAAAVSIKPNDVLAKNKLDKAKEKEGGRLKKIEEAKKNIKSNDNSSTTKTVKKTPPKVVENKMALQEPSKKVDYEDFEKRRAQEREDLRRKKEEEEAKKRQSYNERNEARKKELEQLEQERNKGASDFQSKKAAEREAMKKKIEEENRQRELNNESFKKKKEEELELLNSEREQFAKEEEETRRRKLAELNSNNKRGSSSSNGWDDDLGEKVNKNSAQVEIDMKATLDKEQVKNYEDLQKKREEHQKQKLEKEESSRANRMQQYDSISVQKEDAKKYQRDNSEEIRKKADEYEKYRNEISDSEQARKDRSKAGRELSLEEIGKIKKEQEKKNDSASEKNKETYKSFEAYKKGIEENEQERSKIARDKRVGTQDDISKVKENQSSKFGEDADKNNRDAYKDLDSYKEELTMSDLEKNQTHVNKRDNATKEIEETKQAYLDKQNNSEIIKKNNDDLYAQQKKMREIEQEREEIRKKRGNDYLKKTEELGKKEKESEFEGNELSAKYPEGITEEVYEQKNEAGVIVKTTIRRIVVRGKYADEYRKIVAKWGTTYFKNGMGVSETVWTTETVAKKEN